mmetsp:Transcript_11123/g.23638  ORF Transcript_11123/g.23638 Transcript_11123/m.23638 type:complete len:388 (+) Transcript_11123:183-1346(+)
MVKYLRKLLSSFLLLPLVTPFKTTLPLETKGSRLLSMAMSTSHSELGRVELFFKGPSELQDRVRFLRARGVTSFNIVNKDKKDDVEGWVNSIREVYPEAHVCAHYSLKHNKVPRKGVKEQKELLLQSLKKTDADEILVISGSGEKKEWNTLEALKFAVQDGEGAALHRSSSLTMSKKLRSPKIAVAYNPYFPSHSDQEKENRRLTEKLATGCVSKIYLQFGTDLERLQKGLELIQNENISSSNGTGSVDIDTDVGIGIAGSLFLPSKKLIAQQKFRPWNGVFLSDKFLKGPEQASAIISKMIQIYKANNVEILWEAPGIRTEKEMEVVQELLHGTATATGVPKVGPLVGKPQKIPSAIRKTSTDDRNNSSLSSADSSVTKRIKRNIA